jgi:predicted Zn finger-like uncharacterized protein
MSLATRCPSCGTVFRVVRDQLKVSDGWVRCGRCAEVFNAAQRLFELENDGAGAAAAPAPPSTGRGVAPPQGLPDTSAAAQAGGAGHDAATPAWYAADGPAPAAPAAAAAPTWAPPTVSQPGSAAAAEVEAEAPIAAAPPTPTPLPPPPPPPEAEIEAGAAATAGPSPGSRPEAGPEASAAATGAPDTAETETGPAVEVAPPYAPPYAPTPPRPPTPPASTEPPAPPPAAGGTSAPRLERETAATGASADAGAMAPHGADAAPAAAAQADAAATSATEARASGPAPALAPAAGAADAADEPTPEFIRRADRAARRRQPVRRGPMAALALGLLVLLAGQVGIHYRDLLAASWPAARPVLQAACSVFGCRVGAPRRIEALSVESSSLARMQDSALYRLSLVVRNRATTPVRMPAVELALSDVQGLTVVRRVLSTAELGQPAESLPASGEVVLQATLDLGERRVAGYTVELFYP